MENVLIPSNDDRDDNFSGTLRGTRIKIMVST
jgi:hypothetical protein